MNTIRFISSNPFKIKEAKEILGEVGVEVIPIELKVEEIQSNDTSNLIRHKALKAFEKIGRPLFIEHTGLYLKYINDFPGGLTQIFWDKLQSDKFTELFGKVSDRTAIAKTTIGYVDGKRLFIFEGEIMGQIAEAPRGNKDFQWDCVFIPDNFNQTFAEMGNEKNKISMRKKALDDLANFLKGAKI
ncbi:TPA: hypothetical protein ROY02_003027 [Bacillus cereus]|nr:hypothetical protein [Bacillus cereus]